MGMDCLVGTKFQLENVTELCALKKMLRMVNCMLRFTTIKMFSRPSLAVQWLRLCTSNAGGRAEGLSPAWGTGSYMLCSAAKKKKVSVIKWIHVCMLCPSVVSDSLQPRGL